jgi:hypothetical protein
MTITAYKSLHEELHQPHISEEKFLSDEITIRACDISVEARAGPCKPLMNCLKDILVNYEKVHEVRGSMSSHRRHSVNT